MMRRDFSDLENMPPVNIPLPRRRSEGDEQVCCVRVPPMGSPSGGPSVTALPVREGNVTALHTAAGRTIRVPVVLKVYASSFEHYAVVSQDKVTCRDCGYVNLKHCTVMSSQSLSPSPTSSSTELSSTSFLCPQLSSSPSSLSSSPERVSPTPFLSSSPHGLTASPTRTLPSHWFQLAPSRAEGQTLTFSVVSAVELSDWLAVLQPAAGAQDSATEDQRRTGSPHRKALGEVNPHRSVSPKLGHKSLMPPLEEE